jgi:hypothetical protein
LERLVLAARRSSLPLSSLLKRTVIVVVSVMDHTSRLLVYTT